MVGEQALVGVVMGSASDADVMKGCTETLKELGISYETRVISAHRTPNQAQEYAASASERGLHAIIAGAGWAAHLAGFMAAHTTLPVIGIPIDSSPLKGMDSLLSTVQMPPGVPVATVSLGKGGAINAAILAAQILALKYPAIAQRLKAYREKLTREVLEKSETVKL
jgi:phosphoribosylaminoimidazole carboxylase PurE protein